MAHQTQTPSFVEGVFLSLGNPRHQRNIVATEHCDPAQRRLCATTELGNEKFATILFKDLLQYRCKNHLIGIKISTLRLHLDQQPFLAASHHD